MKNGLRFKISSAAPQISDAKFGIDDRIIGSFRSQMENEKFFTKAARLTDLLRVNMLLFLKNLFCLKHYERYCYTRKTTAHHSISTQLFHFLLVEASLLRKKKSGTRKKLGAQ